MFNLLKHLPKSFFHSPFAHRGYHDCNGIFKEGKGPENSRRSIIHAIQNGLGVEIDIRFTKDYIPVVIHDDYLKRLCGVDKYLSNTVYRELSLLKLNNNENLPTLEEILGIIDGHTPVLIEFKKLNKTQDLINIKKELYSLLSSYSGPLAMMSFDLKLISHLSKRLPDINIGLVLKVSKDLQEKEVNVDHKGYPIHVIYVKRKLEHLEEIEPSKTKRNTLKKYLLLILKMKNKLVGIL